MRREREREAMLAKGIGGSERKKETERERRKDGQFQQEERTQAIPREGEELTASRVQQGETDPQSWQTLQRDRSPEGRGWERTTLGIEVHWELGKVKEGREKVSPESTLPPPMHFPRLPRPKHPFQIPPDSSRDVKEEI